MKKEYVIKILVIFVLTVIVGLAIKVKFDKISENYVFYDKLDKQIDRKNWYVGSWESNDPSYDKVFIEESAINLKTVVTDEGPYILTKPMSINWKKPKIIKITRRVKIIPTDSYFAGGLVFYQTFDNKLIPKFIDENPFGDSLFQIEYIKNNIENSDRPGKEVFRVLTPTWKTQNHYILEEPIYNEWFDEEIIYNDKTGQLSYKINDREPQYVRVPKINKNYFRIRMHGYGHFQGQQCLISDFKVQILDK